MARIVWDGGALENVWVGTPAARFNGYAPRSVAVGQRRALLANGAPRMWKYREDHTVSVTLRDIGRDQVAACLALQLHLTDAGTVQLEFVDTLGSTYPTCALAPDADPPELTQDPETMRWSMTFALINVDGTPITAQY